MTDDPNRDSQGTPPRSDERRAAPKLEQGSLRSPTAEELERLPPCDGKRWRAWTADRRGGGFVETAWDAYEFCEGSRGRVVRRWFEWRTRRTP